jgi:hypothetical protein
MVDADLHSAAFETAAVCDAEAEEEVVFCRIGGDEEWRSPASASPVSYRF